MSDPTPPRARSRHVTFHARIAGVALVTTVAVLLAACVTFLLQQWAVASHDARAHQSAVAEVAAAAAGPALAAGQIQQVQNSLASLEAAPDVLSAKIVDPTGLALARYSRAARTGDRGEVIRADVRHAGDIVGQLQLTVRPPTLAGMLPQFLALTGALFFGATGIALFLARGLAQGVIAPVERLSDAMAGVAASGKFTPVRVEADDALFRNLTRSFNALLAQLDANDKELRQTLGELTEARDAANAANVLKSQFLANMSHEIRTPLNGVLAMAEVMAMGEMPDAQRERLDVIRQSGGLLLAVLNDVLDLSKIEAGKLVLSTNDFELEQLFKGVEETFALQARDKGLGFRVRLAPEAAGFWRGDSDRLRQILGNLIANAIKFTPDGTISVEARMVEGDLRLEVSDTGVGIAADKLPTLFEKFVQADNSATRRFGGTGLGLAICRELAQLMGGHIWAESVEGRGSTFFVQLPLARAARPQPAPQPAAAELDDSQPRAVRILAAEDNPTNQRVLHAIMSSLELDVEIVPHGRAAVEAWEQGAYDLILMDIQMPVMDGIDAAKAIRASERAGGRRRTPIVALTANALAHQVDEYFAAGMDGHVAKPIEIAKLYAAITQAIAGHAQVRAA